MSLGSYRGGASQAGAVDPASNIRAITPHASNDLPDGVAKALWIGAAGNITVLAENDTVEQTLPVQPGVFPVRVRAVRTSGTTATPLWALY